MLLVNLPRIIIDPGFIWLQILLATWLDWEHFPHLKLWQLKRANLNFPYHPLWTHVKIWGLELLHLLISTRSELRITQQQQRVQNKVQATLIMDSTLYPVATIT
jgi:hypothetical protein